MKYRNLRGLKVSALGFGCMGMSAGYGKAGDKKEMIALVCEAIDLGLNFFDTAEAYGPYTNEELVGEALQGRRDKVILASKFGFDLQNGRLDSRPEHIKEAIEDSLRRLRTDYIDLYYQHRVDPKVPIEEVAHTMNELKKEGKIRAFGMSEAEPKFVERANAISPVSALQNEYSLWTREAEKEAFGLCERLDIGFVSWGTMGQGFFSGKVQANEKFGADDFRSMFHRFTPEALKANQVLLDFIRELADSKKATPAQIALAWALAQKPFIVPIVGINKSEHLKENLGALELSFSNEELAEIKKRLESITIVGDRLCDAFNRDILAQKENNA